MHNHHRTHVELTTLGGVHGSLEGFVVDGKKRRGKTAGEAKLVKQDDEIAKQPDDQSNTNESNVEDANEPREKEHNNAGTERHVQEESSAQSAAVDTNVAAPTTKPTNSPIVITTTRKTITNKSNELTNNTKDAIQNEHKIINPTDSIHPVAHLSCADHGGPSDPDIIDSMVFWSDIPSDSSYVSPMYEEGNEKYLTFEPDHGGWNNIRMAMETALVMSHAMGRTLVLPPEQGMYLMSANHDGQKSQFSFSTYLLLFIHMLALYVLIRYVCLELDDFFHLDSIAIEHKGFKVITTEEFLKREAITGGLKDYDSHQVKYPPNNRTDWNGGGSDPLFKYLRSVANTPTWDPWECALAIPANKDQSSIDELNTTLKAIMDGSYGKPRPTLEEFNGNPTPVDAPLGDRMREMLADRPGLCIYDKPLQEEKLIHMKVHGGVRLLTHFYAFIFFADWRQDLWSKREFGALWLLDSTFSMSTDFLNSMYLGFVRDHLRYVDDIVCAAARVLEAVKEHARKNTKHKPSTDQGIFDAMHVRLELPLSFRFATPCQLKLTTA